jgi:uncharacterized membrane protein
MRGGREVSRVEGFSDLVFGFALALLVVSLEVPTDFAQLKIILGGFLPFAVTFSLVCWIWYQHYAFFRLYDVEDPFSIALNCALLYIVLFFVYPLKFVFASLIPSFGTNWHFGFRDMSPDDGRLLLWSYSAGFAALFLVFMLLYWNVYRRRDEFQLTPRQVFEARIGIRTHAISAGVGLLSMVLAFVLPIRLLGLAGMIYALMGPLHWRNGVVIGRQRERAFPSSTPALP